MLTTITNMHEYSLNALNVLIWTTSWMMINIRLCFNSISGSGSVRACCYKEVAGGEAIIIIPVYPLPLLLFSSPSLVLYCSSPTWGSIASLFSSIPLSGPRVYMPKPVIHTCRLLNRGISITELTAEDECWTWRNQTLFQVWGPRRLRPYPPSILWDFPPPPFHSQTTNLPTFALHPALFF